MFDREEITDFLDRAKAIVYGVLGFSIGVAAMVGLCWVLYTYLGPYVKMML